MHRIRRSGGRLRSTVPLWLAVFTTPSAMVAQSIPVEASEVFGYAAPEEVGLSPGAVRQLAVRATEWVRDGDVVGAELLLIKDRRIVLHEAVGWSEGAAGIPLQRNSVYHMASMTKPFTGTAVLMLTGEGRLELDAAVSNWLPSWDTPETGGVTVRQLLTHTAGWANEGSGPATPLSEYPDVMALADRVAAEGPRYSPGEGFRYGDAHSYTLAALVEAASGMSAGDFIEERILEPLGLDDTGVVFDASAPWASRVNPTYRSGPGGWEKYWDPAMGPRVPYFYGAGGMFSTALDYATWLDAWMGWIEEEDGSGTGLVPGELARAAIRPEATHRGYGFHWYLYGTNPLVFGHGGADGTRAYAVPSEDAILIILTQSRGTPTRTEWLDLLASVLPDVARVDSLPEVAAGELALPIVETRSWERDRLVGQYAVGSDTLTVSEHEGRLALDAGFWPPYDLVSLGDGVFAMGIYEDGELRRIAGPRARLRFVFEEERVTALRVVILPDERVDFEAARVR